MSYYLYLASNSYYRPLGIGKIGCTENPHARLKTYLTGCAPGLNPSQDIVYDAIWETTAKSREELRELEELVHDRFYKRRMMRGILGDSEWFNFDRLNPLEQVEPYLNSQTWIKGKIHIDEIKVDKNYLNKSYHKNKKNYIKSEKCKNEVLDQIQEPVIFAIKNFITSKLEAGYIIAPCGSGKTIMTCRGINGLKRVIICCPSYKIQTQWATTLLSQSCFLQSQIYIISSIGITNPEKIRRYFENETYCIITTNMSSHLLVDYINRDLELFIIDEAHHMAGIVAVDTEGEGLTRRLMVRTVELGIKRLSLTYTPRFIRENETNWQYLTMDDETIFGSLIYELKIRDLINQGVLPDYRLWTIRDETMRGTGIIGKTDYIVNAWNTRETVRREEKYMLNHLIVFSQNISDGEKIRDYLKIHLTEETAIFHVQSGDDLDEQINKFSAASRAIMINCWMLSEGVDVPIADSVIIMYPKKSRGQITQMILRAGRWYKEKSVFHVLIPVIEDEDLSGFEEVLTALASCDKALQDEIVLRANSGTKSEIESEKDMVRDETPEYIIMEGFDAIPEEIGKCFRNIRKNIFGQKDWVQRLCIERKVDTSLEYEKLRFSIPELPENPLAKGETWFNFLHPYDVGRINREVFSQEILKKNRLQTGQCYHEWREKNSKELPLLQHITDGYFGLEWSNYNRIYEMRTGKLRRG